MDGQREPDTTEMLNIYTLLGYAKEGAFFMNIHESAEDYLETILVLKQRLGMVRSIDIVRELGFAKPSVSVAMKRLRENPKLAAERQQVEAEALRNYRDKLADIAMN